MAKKREPITITQPAKKKGNIPQNGLRATLAMAGLKGMGNINSTFDASANLLRALKKNGISRAQYDVMNNRAKIENWAKNKTEKFKSQTQFDEGLAELLKAMGINKNK